MPGSMRNGGYVELVVPLYFVQSRHARWVQIVREPSQRLGHSGIVVQLDRLEQGADGPVSIRASLIVIRSHIYHPRSIDVLWPEVSNSIDA